MSITYVGAAYAASTSVTLPSFTPGDIAFVLAENFTSTAISAPSGWNILDYDDTTVSSTPRMVGYRILQSGDTTTGTWTGSVATTVIIYNGAHPILPIDGLAITRSAASSTTITAAALTPAYSTTVPIGLMFSSSQLANAYNYAPTSMTNHTSALASGYAGSAGASAGAYAGGTWTSALSAAYNSYTIGLRAQSVFPIIADDDTTSGTQTSNSTSWTLTYPNNISAGDMLIAIIASDGGSGYVQNVPSGWPDAIWKYNQESSSGANALSFGKRICTGTESGNFTVTMNASEQGSWIIYRIPAGTWYGTDPSGSFVNSSSDSVVRTSTGGTSDTPDPPSLDPAGWDAENTLWLTFIGVDTSRTVSAFPSSPDTFTNTDSLVSGGANGSTLAWGRLEKNATSVDPGTFTISTSDDWNAITIAVRGVLSFTYSAQAQAEVASGGPTTTRFHAQAQSDIKTTYNSFAQSNTDILQVYQVFAQAQSDIKATYQSYAQAQAALITTLQGFGQAQANILAKYNVFAQSQATIKQVYTVFAQAQAGIKQTYPFGGGGYSTIVRETFTSGGTGSASNTHSVNAPSGFTTGDVVAVTIGLNGSSINSVPTGFALVGSATGQTNPKVYVYVGKYADVGAGPWSWGSTASIYDGWISARYSGVDQTTIQDVTAVGTDGAAPGTGDFNLTGITTVTDGAMVIAGVATNSSSADQIVEDNFLTEIAAVFQSSAIKNTEMDDGTKTTAGATGLLHYTLNSNVAYAGVVGALRPASGGGSVVGPTFAQAQASIIKTKQVYAQAQASVLTAYQVFAQGQADILQVYAVFAQAQSDILQVYQVFAQAQTSIVTTLQISAQAQAQIKQTYQGYAQAQANIKTTYTVFAQAQTDIKQTYPFGGTTTVLEDDFAGSGNLAGSALITGGNWSGGTYWTSGSGSVSATRTGVAHLSKGTPSGTLSYGHRAGTATHSDFDIFITDTGDGYFEDDGLFTYNTRNLAIWFRGIDANNFYYVAIATSSLLIYRRTSGSFVSVASYAISPQAFESWRVRAEVTGSSPTTLRAKAWKVGTSEPGWLIDTTDNTAGNQTTDGAVGMAALELLSSSLQSSLDVGDDFLLTTGGAIEGPTFAQAQASIIKTKQTYAQAQAWIKQTYQSYAQAQTQIKQTYQVFAQAQAQIPVGVQTFQGYAQAQADILTTYEEFAQAQADILQTYIEVAQANADILQTYQIFAQAQADIQQTYTEYAQVQAQVMQTYEVFAQAQTQILQIYLEFAQANADILTSYQGYAQAEATIIQTYQAYAQAQANIKTTYAEYAQAQASILQTYQSYAQANASILAVYQAFAQGQATLVTTAQVFAQAQALIIPTREFAQAQATILATTLEFAQAMAYMTGQISEYAQAQASILAVYDNYAQAQAQILQTYQGYAQAESWVLATYQQYAQANADIKQAYTEYAQAQAWIRITVLEFAQAQADVKQTYEAYAQAQAWIKATYLVYAQAQAWLKVTDSVTFAQAQADILQTYQGFAQANAYILTTNTEYAQAQAMIYLPQYISPVADLSNEGWRGVVI